MHKPESVWVNETHKIIWDLEMQMDHLIQARNSTSGWLTKKKKKEKENFCPVNFAILVNHRVKIKENEKTDKYLDLAREQKKSCETWGWWWYQF